MSTVKKALTVGKFALFISLAIVCILVYSLLVIATPYVFWFAASLLGGTIAFFSIDEGIAFANAILELAIQWSLPAIVLMFVSGFVGYQLSGPAAYLAGILMGGVVALPGAVVTTAIIRAASYILSIPLAPFTPQALAYIIAACSIIVGLIFSVLEIYEEGWILHDF